MWVKCAQILRPHTASSRTLRGFRQPRKEVGLLCLTEEDTGAWGDESFVPGHRIIEAVNDSLCVSPDLLPPQMQRQRNRIS